MNNFLELVKVEREKQINKHGYTHEHDDEHTDGSIADAAACYAATNQMLYGDDFTEMHNGIPSIKYLFPWDSKYLKREEKTRKEQIITACAMLMAEYERLERLDKQ